MSKSVTTYEDKFAAEADKYADAEKVAGTFISLQGGVLKLDDSPLPGNQICVVVLDAIRENTFYATRFDPDVMEPPKCYAFGYSDKEMTPHESMDEDEDRKSVV